MRRAIISGIAFGLCVTAADLGLGAQRMIAMRLPATPAAALQAAGFEIALAALLGLILGPLLLRFGRTVHVAALAVLWALLARIVALDPDTVMSWILAPAIGLVACGVGAAIAKWSRRTAWVLGVLALAAAILTPVFVDLDRPAIAVQSPTVKPRVDAPDVILIVLDTVRAANMSSYGYARHTSPTFDALAKEGALFLDATAPSTWSLPSHASLFTGLFPSVHGAHDESRVLARDVPTLAEVLGANGYETLSFTANPHISDGFGLTRGFQKQDRAWLGPSAGRSFMFIYRVLDLFGWTARDKGGKQVVADFQAWLSTRPRHGRPAFVFINFLEAHFPYHQTPLDFLERYTDLGPLDRRAASMEAMAAQFGRKLTSEEVDVIAPPSRDMYDAGVSYSDYLLHCVMVALRASAGRLDHALLVVLSDHGEMLGEHEEFGHGPALYEQDLHVPLLLRYPAKIKPGTRIERPVSTVGVYATVLDAVGVQPPRRPQVASLLPVLDGGRGGEPVLAERLVMRDALPDAEAAPLARRDIRYRVLRNGSRKLVVTSTGETLLFDLAKDPREEQDVSESDPERTKALRKELDTWVAALGLMPLDQPLADSGVPRPIDPAAEAQLRALGYVE